MSKVSTKICVMILERALQPDSSSPKVFPDPEVQKKEVFRNEAFFWKKFKTDEFLNFARKHQIRAETPIAVADLGDDKFAVIKT